MLGLALTNSIDCKTQDTFECRAFQPAPPETNRQNENDTDTTQNKQTQHTKTSSKIYKYKYI